jgi:hypothetical protein
MNFTSIWTRCSHEAIDALNRSPLYRETVEEIEATGFITGRASADVFDIHDGSLDALL